MPEPGEHCFKSRFDGRERKLGTITFEDLMRD